MAAHLLLFSSPPKFLSQNPNPIHKSRFNFKPIYRFHCCSTSRREAISIVSQTLALILARSLCDNALAETVESSPPRKQTLDVICSTRSWFQFFGDRFSIRVPPQFEDIMEPEDYNAGLSLYGDKVKPKAFAARFASADGSEVLSVVIRPTSQLKITFLEAKDITDLGSIKNAAKIFVPGGTNLYSARVIKIKEDEGFRTYYFYEFGNDDQHAALVAAVNSGKGIPQSMIHASICGESTVMLQKNKNKQATSAASRPLGMCEKLYNAFQPTLRPLRRLTFQRQEADTTLTSATHSDHHQHHIPQSKPPETAAPLTKDKHNHKVKAQEKKKHPLPAPAKAVVKPLGAVLPATKEEAQKPKKGFNERVDDYIIRTKGKIRVGSGVGRISSSK